MNSSNVKSNSKVTHTNLLKYILFVYRTIIHTNYYIHTARCFHKNNSLFPNFQGKIATSSIFPHQWGTMSVNIFRAEPFWYHLEPFFYCGTFRTCTCSGYNFTVFVIVRTSRKHTLSVPTVRKHPVRLRASAFRQKELHGSGVFAQRLRMDPVVVRRLRQHAVLVLIDDGPGLGLHRRPGVFLRRGDLRTKTPGHHVVRHKHVLSDRDAVLLRSGLRFSLENRSRTQRHLPGDVSAARHIREYFITFSNVIK